MLRSFLLTHAFPFVFGLTIGLLASFLFETTERSEDGLLVAIDSPVIVSGGGWASCNGASTEDSKLQSKNSNEMKILSKQQAKYTEEARERGIQGEVLLKVMFMKNGAIGAIQTEKELPFGLTDEAYKAARRITFEPAKQNGSAVTITKKVVYRFSIY